MTVLKIVARPCFYCGHDVPRLHPVPDNFYRVICDPEDGGCGMESQPGITEAAALDLWNNGPDCGLWGITGRATA